MSRPSRSQRILDWFEQRVNLTEIFSLLSIYGLFYTEVDTRKPIREALREALAKPVPAYYKWPRVLGLLALILFLNEVLTGVLLAFYYQPTNDGAYSSLLLIARDVNLGWFVRQMHYWGGQMLLVVILLRLVRFFFSGLYRKPRELVWGTGALMCIAAVLLDFSGRLLTWNNDAYWSAVRSLEVIFSIPLVGSLAAFLLGGGETWDLDVSRFYFLHILVLPVLFWLLLYLSFSTIRRVGLSEIAGEERQQGRAAYLDYLYTLLILVLLILGGLVTMSVLWPVSFGVPVNPYETPPGIATPWYLLAPYGLVEFLPAWLPAGVRSGLLLLCLLVFILVPALDRGEFHAPHRLWILRVLGVLVIAGWIILSVYGLSLDQAV